MGWFGDDHETAQCYDQVCFSSSLCNLMVTSVKYQNAPKHEASVTHELLSGAAAYEV
jgi:hypothetical protein